MAQHQLQAHLIARETDMALVLKKHQRLIEASDQELMVARQHYETSLIESWGGVIERYDEGGTLCRGRKEHRPILGC